MRISTLFYNFIIALNGYGMQKYIHFGKEKMRIFYLEAEISKKVFRDFEDVFAYLGVHKIKISPRTILSRLQSLVVYQNDGQNVGQTSTASQTAHRC